jgi:hypothetical protein
VVQSLESRHLLTTLLVTSVADSGPSTLRQALLDANDLPGSDTIDFAIPGPGVHTISPLTQLPYLTDQVIIDGYSQPGSSPNTLAVGDDAVINIQLDGGYRGFNGLEAYVPGNTIQGLAIGGFRDGIRLADNGSNVVQGNFLGIAADGSTRFGNLEFGLFNDGGAGNLIGGATPAARNLISGNYAFGIFVAGGTSVGNVIQGNYIGVNADGLVAVPNTYDGIQINYEANHTVIGGVQPGEGNVISGNGGSGIAILGSNYYTPIPTYDSILGNLVGLDATGSAKLGNGDNGMYIETGSNTVGGPAGEGRNVVSGNSRYGVILQTASATQNLVLGNYIGTDAAGATGIGNGITGAALFYGATGNTIGGTNPGDGNLLSGNGFYGSEAYSADGNAILGNFVGTDATGLQAIGNTLDGIQAKYGASNNTIGGTTPGAGNLIAFNLGNGVGLPFAGTGNSILGNLIHDNGKLGIDLGDDGVTPNDSGDGDQGPNNLQNFPVLTTAERHGNRVVFQGVIHSTPDTTVTLQFFANDDADPSGFGEGARFVGQVTVITDASGDAIFEVTFKTGTHPGAYFTATATDAEGSTSEFSAAVALTKHTGHDDELTLDGDSQKVVPLFVAVPPDVLPSITMAETRPENGKSKRR